MNIARRRSHIDFQTATKLLDRDDEFRDDDFDDNDFMEAGKSISLMQDFLLLLTSPQRIKPSSMISILTT